MIRTRTVSSKPSLNRVRPPGWLTASSQEPTSMVRAPAFSTYRPVSSRGRDAAELAYPLTSDAAPSTIPEARE